MRITMPLSVYEINRKHTVNHHYFDQIDSEEKAYWLGFLWADGSISKTATRCSGKNRLTLSQKIKEIKHLKKFADALHSDSSIQIREPMPNQKIAVLQRIEKAVALAAAPLRRGEFLIPLRIF